jgi:hypothetical protein
VTPAAAARQRLTAALAAYNGLPVAEAQQVIGRWRKAHGAPVVAFAHIDAAWSSPFVILTPEERLPRDQTEPPTALGALIEGVRFANALKGSLARERKVLVATLRAAEGVKAVRAFVEMIAREAEEPVADTPLDIHSVDYPGEIEAINAGLETLSLLISLRQKRARRAHTRFEVGREAESKANVKSPLAGLTREGLKRAARRPRDGAPNVGLGDIALVLKVTFAASDTVNEKKVENWTARRPVLGADL